MFQDLEPVSRNNVSIQEEVAGLDELFELNILRRLMWKRIPLT